jgi:phosphomannomutase/phosphoglucomutase
MISPHIFRAYDIRGIAYKDFDAKGANTIGMAFATFLKKINPKAKKIAIGRDGRLHSKEFHQNFAKGVMDCGISVTDIGLSTSPLLNFAVCFGGFDGGVNVTASHNPKQFNGFKLQGKNAHSIFGDEIQKIYQIAKKSDFAISSKKGVLIKKDFSKDWLDKLSSLVKIEGKPKIVVDCGNGVTGKFARKFFEMIGTDVDILFEDVDGNFPNHEANPEEEENLKKLKEKVIEKKASLGIAFDGDGDRVGVVDEKGHYFAADLLLLMLARDVLKRNPKTAIVYDLKATQVLADEIKNLGGKAILCKTGHSFVENKMKEENALLGGEVSGHLFFAENYYGFDDAFLAAAKIVEIVQKTQKPLKDHFKDLPKTYVTPEIKVKIEEDKKFATMEKIVNHFTSQFPNQTLTIDGVRIDFLDGAWGIVRASNTSAYLTLRFEAREKSKLKEIQNIVFSHLKSYPQISCIPETP